MFNLILCKSLQVPQPSLPNKQQAAEYLMQALALFNPEMCIFLQKRPSHRGKWKSKLRNAWGLQKGRCFSSEQKTPSDLVLQTAMQSELLTNQQAESIAAGQQPCGGCCLL